MRAAIINGFDIYKYKGGTELYTKGLVDWLISQNIDVDIITFTQGYEYDFFELGSNFEKYEKFYDLFLFIANNFYAFSYEPNQAAALCKIKNTKLLLEKIKVLFRSNRSRVYTIWLKTYLNARRNCKICS